MEYTNRNFLIQWQRSISIKIIHQHFLLAKLCPDIHISNFVTFKIQVKVRCTTFAVAPFDGKYQTSYLMAIVMFEFVQPILVKIAN